MALGPRFRGDGEEMLESRCWEYVSAVAAQGGEEELTTDH
jgi:hypothetical protein